MFAFRLQFLVIIVATCWSCDPGTLERGVDRDDAEDSGDGGDSGDAGDSGDSGDGGDSGDNGDGGDSGEECISDRLTVPQDPSDLCRCTVKERYRTTSILNC